MQLGGLGERCELPQRDLVHFSFERWDLLATILIIFLRIN